MLQVMSDDFKHTCFVDIWDFGSIFGPKMGKNKVILTKQ